MKTLLRFNIAATLLLAILIVGVLYLRAQSSSTNCPPGQPPMCPFPDCEFSVFYPHPNDCHYFFYCSNGVAYCKECPADLHWSVELETCDYPFRAGCDPSYN